MSVWRSVRAAVRQEVADADDLEDAHLVVMQSRRQRRVGGKAVAERFLPILEADHGQAALAWRVDGATPDAVAATLRA